MNPVIKPQVHRLAPAPSQIIDRARELDFSFDGRRYRAHPGDTIASALAAAGIRTFSRSFKYHRRRGLLCVSGDCPNCLVQVGDEPNVRSCRRLVEPGMAVHSQNAWPTLQFDLMSLVQWFSRFLPAGFYYKAFMRPRALWPLYERLLRRMAGLGNVAADSRPKETYKEHLHADVVVIGGGPAGMKAAHAAVHQGAEVILIDEGRQLGGQLCYRSNRNAEQSAQERAQMLRSQLQDLPRLQVLEQTTVVGLYERTWIAAVQGRRLTKLRAKSLVLASGEMEYPLAFENNDLPGVMLGAGVQRLLRLWGVAPGKRAVVVSANPHGPQIALDLLEAGVELAALIDVSAGRPAGVQPDGSVPEPEAEALATLRQAGARFYRASQIVRARGRREIEAVEFVDQESDRIVSIACDLLALSTGLAPANSLLHLAGAELRWDPESGQILPHKLPPNLFAAGGVAGTHEVQAAEMEGQRAGLQAAMAAGYEDAAARQALETIETRLQTRHTGRRPWSHNAHFDSRPGGDHGHRFLCLCEDVTGVEIWQSMQEGFSSSELLKRYSTVSMGPCQGKMCNANVMQLCARLSGRPLEQVGGTTARPPIRPVKLGHYSGRLLEPTRLSPLHDWHLEQGARMMVAGAWLRPEHYGDPQSEVRAVRESVGLIDVSTLGKMHLQGPDSPRLLELIYTNRWRSLEPGRVRYGVMVNEEGVVLDDGVTARLGDDFYYLTTTSGGAARVYEWIEWWLQSSRPLAVNLVNATELRAAMNLTGPLARRVLNKIADGIDLSPQAFPYMHARQARLAGIPALLLRIGFTGELGYEIHVPSGYGLDVWQALMQAGEEHGIRPFGVEAQRVLRLEKGHLIVGQDTDGLSNPLEAGLGWAVKLEKDDFLGKPSLLRVQERGLTQRLVGFEMLDGGSPQEANQIVKPGRGPLGLEIIGRVTSARYSDTLGRAIGLCWLPAKTCEPGTEFTIRVRGQLRKARVVELPFYDPQGIRLRA